jgi:tetratricopeptide (TPR) repeat protein
MKRITFYAAGIIAIATLAACSSNEEGRKYPALMSNMEKRNLMVAEIDSLEAIFQRDTFALNSEVGPLLLQRYTTFAEMFVGDKEKTPLYLYKGAAMSRGVGLPLKAQKMYDRILREYPEFDRCPEVAFLIAFVYDEDMKQPDLAKEAYQDVIRRFPGDHWALQAQARLETIDMSDEELIQYLMRKNGMNS